VYRACTAEEESLRAELRAYFATIMTRDGWLGIGWPEEYGGQGRVGGT